MNINNLNELPEWKDDADEGEGWKNNDTLVACKALYEKWNEVMIMLHGALGTVKEIGEEEDDSFTKDLKGMLLGDAFEVGVKIRSSEAGGIYVIRMENAGIIRKNAQFVKSSVLTLMIEGEIDEQHGETIREEIDAFRELFVQWVNSFEKDEYTDEWGLFV
ncbi:MAG: hypothetical protein JWQ40_1795 [Segetibacter sp.]|nr:hypothetical protein [Segetibacter sp.]